MGNHTQYYTLLLQIHTQTNVVNGLLLDVDELKHKYGLEWILLLGHKQ